MLDNDVGHLCRGMRIQISGHSDFGIFHTVGASSILILVYADTASAACPAQPGSLGMISMTFAAVICDADEPRSVNTVYAPESSFTMSPRSTNIHLYIWNFGSNSTVLRWQKSINDAKWTLFLFLCASRMTSFLLLTLSSFQAWIVSSFFPLFFHYCLCVQNLHRFLHGNDFVFQPTETSPFAAMWSSRLLWRVSSTRCLVDSWGSMIQAYFVCGTFVGCSKPWKHNWLGLFFLHGMAVSTCTSEFCPRFFDSLFIFCLPDQENQFPSILRAYPSFGFSFAHYSFSRLSAALLRLIHTFATRDPVLSSFELLSVSLRTTQKSFGRFSFTRVNFVKPVLIDSPIIVKAFSCMTSRFVWVDLVTWLFFSGVVNVLFSARSWTRGSAWWR